MPILQWLNRDKSIKEAGRVPYRLLKADPKLSYGDENTENMLIQGDNLDALKALLPYYAGKVKCIYIDPPYNTESFQNEHYDDNLEHTTWLSIIYPRLEILRELLSEDGLIFIQIDDHQSAYLTVICDEIFGRKSRVNNISVKMSEVSGVKMAHVEKRLPKLKETILVYRKSISPSLDIEHVPVDKWNDEYKTLLLGLSQDEIQEIKTLIHQENCTLENVHKCDDILKSAYRVT